MALLTAEEEQRRKDLANYSANLEKSDAEYMAVKGSSFDPVTGKLLSAPVFNDGTPVGGGLGSGKAGSGLGSGKAGSGLNSGKAGSGLGSGTPATNTPATNTGSTAQGMQGKQDLVSEMKSSIKNKEQSGYGGNLLYGSRSSLSSSNGGIGGLGASRTLGTESGAMRTEARRLRKQGYGQAAEKMALAASEARLNEPRILTQAQRGRQSIQNREAGMAIQEAAAAQKEQAQYMRDLYKKRQSDLDKGITPPYTTGQTTI